MYRTIVAGILSLTTSLGLAFTDEKGGLQTTTTVSETTTTTSTSTTVPQRQPSVLDELIGHTIPDIGYVFHRAQCETGLNWRNSGRYNGSLGIYRGTFQQWGGYEDFGVYNASEAPREAQILVWYRVHYIGYDSATRGWVPSAGQLINNCSDYAEKYYDNNEIPFVTVDQNTVDLWRVLIANTGRG